MSQNLNQRIQQFYDHSTDLWLRMWGEHMHHGFYADKNPKVNHQEAQIELIEQTLNWGHINKPSYILDAGCGVGGSARYLAQKYDARALGVNLSAIQVKHAREYTTKAGLDNQVIFRQQDLMTLSKDDGPFDLIWSMENAEHIADKAGMMKLFFNRLQSGGKLLMVTWCTRATSEEPLTHSEKRLLSKLCKWYHLPPWISLEKYQQLAEETGFQQIKVTDWSDYVAPFWGAVIRSALSIKGIKGVMQSGASTIRGAWAMQYMQRGYHNGLIRFGLLQGQKP